MTALAPIRRQVVVPGPPEVAFDVWTGEIGAWWPVADGFSVYGEGSQVAFTGGQLVERSSAGEVSVWGTVLAWEPPGRLVCTWHPGSTPDAASTVEVTFTGFADDAVTLVTVTHHGWESYADPAAARTDYGHGWPQVFAAYSARFTAPAEAPLGAPLEDPVPASPAARSADDSHLPSDLPSDLPSGLPSDLPSSLPSDLPSGDLVDVGPPVWLVLEHTAAADVAGSVFGDPRFGSHIAFLRTLADDGVLVAAGSLPDSSGTGMTVLRLPNATLAAEYVRRAQHDDASVTTGLFDVRVRPWQVALS